MPRLHSNYYFHFSNSKSLRTRVFNLVFLVQLRGGRISFARTQNQGQFSRARAQRVARIPFYTRFMTSGSTLRLILYVYIFCLAVLPSDIANDSLIH